MNSQLRLSIKGSKTSAIVHLFSTEHIAVYCSGWCQLCCGRHCSCWTSPVRRYLQVMLSDQRKLPVLSELKVTNHMNREAIQQVWALPLLQEYKCWAMPRHGIALQSCPALPCPALPCPALPCPALPRPAIKLALPALPRPAPPCPALLLNLSCLPCFALVAALIPLYRQQYCLLLTEFFCTVCGAFVGFRVYCLRV